MNKETVRAEIIQYLKTHVKKSLDASALRDDTNLVEAGLLDSIQFVGLIAALETKFGVELDLVEKPIENFIVLGSLVDQVTGT